ncbi:GNAT family N-acetyltransferase [Mycobacterium sp. MYCO198283]|uniref:N-acetylglutamate synthase, CG3035 family n=1 Tax=Mycobacterium sp. MYCO198283 TaxID=2883505 RepID=UPI001E5BB253|nr:GNAT family N-acetyltransferase [Mycobacterium sp. MYCO198283]MCG5432210.1 GNAT family N-acetyltransferase [Mycobacterium sp. MYCO198283]
MSSRRVAIRYRLAPGSVPPLTDVIGVVVSDAPRWRVRTRSGEEVEVDPADVLSVRELPEAPVRASDIRRLEHAAAFAWPGVEQRWLDGWLLRYGHGETTRANSAVPLEPSASPEAVSEIVAWYRERGVTPWLAAPDRLLRLPPELPVHRENQVLTRAVESAPSSPGVTLQPRPDDDWLALYDREVRPEVLAAVLDGEVVFASVPGAAVGRAAVTTSPDGSRWVGIAAVHVVPAQRRAGHARRVCEALLSWGAARGADRGYVQVLSDNAAALALYDAMGYRPHHRVRYVDGRLLARP